MTNFIAGSEVQVTDADADSVLVSSAIRLDNGNILVLGYAGDNVVTPNGTGSENDVHGVLYTSAGVQIGDSFLVNTTQADDQRIASAAALPGGGFVVIWTSDSIADEAANTGTGQAVMQRFDAAGAKVGSETVLGEVRVNSLTAIVGLPGGGFVTYWASAGNHAFGQAWSAAGEASGAPVDLGTFPNLESVVYTGGRVLLTAFSNDQDVIAVDLGTNGLTVTNGVRVNTYTPSLQVASDVAVLSDGGYVVTWQSYLQDGSAYGIYARRYDAGGTAFGDEVHVSTFTTGGQLAADVAALDNGGYVIVWHSNAQDGSGAGVYGQAFDADGNRMGGEFRVNVTTDGNQGVPQVIGLAGGGFQVFWSSDNGGQPQIFSRIYTLDSSVSLTGDDGDNILVGTAGDDYLDGGYGADQMLGLAGNDTLVISDGGDTADGGDGNDRLVVNADADTPALTAVIETNGTYRIFAVDGSATAVNIESVEFNSGGGNDTLSGLAGDDIIRGNGGFDTIYGGLGADRLEAGAGGGSLWNGANQTVGLAAEDNAVDTLIGGTGADVIYAGLGDIADGGAQPANQVDRIFVSFFGKTSALNLDLSTGDAFATLAAASGGSYSNFEEIGVFGSVFADRVTGTSGNDRIFDLAPADGAGGNDTFYGRGGDDRISAGSGANYVDGGDGNDILYNTSFEAETFIGGLGNDTIFYGSTAPVDTIGNGADTIDGGAGVDAIDYSKLTVSLKVDLNLAAQQATGFNLLTMTGVENIVGGAGNDVFVGNAAANRLDGNAGNDSLDGRGGIDTLAGGLGNDTYIVDNAGDIVIEAAGQGTDIVMASATYALSAEIERLTLTGTANIAGTGNALGNWITGNTGNNKLDGGLGIDTLVGGLGNDTYTVDDAGDKASEASGEGLDQVNAWISYALGSNVENLQLLGTSDINATGNGLNNVIWGNDGANRLDGAAGADKMLGGLGDDTYVIDNASDQATDVAGGGIDLVLASQSHILSQYVENLTLTGTANITATGNAMDNILVGNSGNNRLTGGAGMDAMTGGAGHDTYYVDNVGDTIVELLNQGVDLVQSTVSYVLSDNIDNLFLNGTDNLNGTGNAINNLITGTSGDNILDGAGGVDKLFGGLGDDTYYLDNSSDSAKDEVNGGHDLVYSSASWVMTAYVEDLFLTGDGNITGTGNALANVLSGNAGINKLDGGAGNDTLTGGLGADVFVFGLNSGIDTITDFSGLQKDLINLKAYSHGTAFGGGITVSQKGLDVIIDLGGGNMVTVQNSLQADVVSHIGW